MKTVVKFAIAASLVAGAAAQPHNHGHRHQHAKKHEHGSPVEKRDVTTYVPGPIETTYVYQDGESVDVGAAKKCLEKGECVVVGSTYPSFTPPPPPPPPSTTAAQFFESKTEAPAAPTAYPVDSGTGLTAKFPSGQVSCEAFPSQYGPIPVPWMNLEGWIGIQSTGGWNRGLAISNIVQPVTGPCISGAFCQYACPPGYMSAQWPVDSQGATGQSIGGVFCNSNGMLELTNPQFDTLCTPGCGGITVKNELPGSASICATNYPGTENMNIPLVTQPGGTYPLTNPDAATSYQWKGQYTSRQYYLNNMDVAVEDACVWQSPKYPGSSGNYAPMNIGAGQDIHGITYISLFANLPSSTAQLNFDVEITGDVTAPCALKGGSYTGAGKGCTTALTHKGGMAIITLKPRGS